jgi:hypothetical protein
MPKGDLPQVLTKGTYGVAQQAGTGIPKTSYQGMPGEQKLQDAAPMQGAGQAALNASKQAAFQRKAPPIAPTASVPGALSQRTPPYPLPNISGGEDLGKYRNRYEAAKRDNRIAIQQRAFQGK